MNHRVFLAYLCIGLYNPKVISFLWRIIHLINNPLLYDAYCKKQLVALLLHSYKTIPYYKEIFDKVKLIKKNEIDLEKFAKIPILTKEIIRNRPEDLISVKAKKTYANTSGGSTGEPVQFIQDPVYFARQTADTILFSWLNGKHPGQKEVKLWGSERDIFEGTISIKEKLINLLFNRVLLNSFALTEEKIQRYTDTISRIKPVQIWAYADSILELSKFINKTHLTIFNPKNIICTAGTLYPEIRQEIQKAFPDSRIINQYGSREVGQIACQIGDDNGMMIFSHSNYIELVDPKNQEIITEPNRPGKILVTNINNYSMPLIRFDIGDTAEYCHSATHKHFLYFSKLHGRDNTHFIGNSGQSVHGEYFTHLFYNRSWIKNFQVIQKTPTEIDILYIQNPNTPPSQNDMNDIRDKMKIVLSDEIKVRFIAVENIDKLKSGKYQFVRRDFE